MKIAFIFRQIDRIQEMLLVAWLIVTDEQADREAVQRPMLRDRRRLRPRRRRPRL